jgi:hypothetical protein
MVKRDSSLQRTRFHCSRVQWRQALHHSSQCLALCMVILGLCACGCSAVETHFMKLPTNSFLGYNTEHHWTRTAQEQNYIHFFKVHIAYISMHTHKLPRSNRGEALCREVLLYLFFETSFTVYWINMRWKEVKSNELNIDQHSDWQNRTMFETQVVLSLIQYYTGELIVTEIMECRQAISIWATVSNTQPPVMLGTYWPKKDVIMIKNVKWHVLLK